MKKFFFWCVFSQAGTSGSPPLTGEGLLDVIADSEASARLALEQRIMFELPRLQLVSAELRFSRCESLTEFIRKAA